jgi:hypothetical protein
VKTDSVRRAGDFIHAMRQHFSERRKITLKLNPTAWINGLEMRQSIGKSL